MKRQAHRGGQVADKQTMWSKRERGEREEEGEKRERELKEEETREWKEEEKGKSGRRESMKDVLTRLTARFPSMFCAQHMCALFRV